MPISVIESDTRTFRLIIDHIDSCLARGQYDVTYAALMPAMKRFAVPIRALYEAQSWSLDFREDWRDRTDMLIFEPVGEPGILVMEAPKSHWWKRWLGIKK